MYETTVRLAGSLAAAATMYELAWYFKFQYRILISEPADKRNVLLSVKPKYRPFAECPDVWGKNEKKIKIQLMPQHFGVYVT